MNLTCAARATVATLPGLSEPLPVDLQIGRHGSRPAIAEVLATLRATPALWRGWGQSALSAPAWGAPDKG